jgi:LmbE family N-acetylglucosaminyl deacetylase
MKTVLVIASHPDDETLGAGGTLLKHIQQGDRVHWCIVTQMFEDRGFTSEQILKRKKQIEKVSKLYGFAETHFLGFPTTALDEFPLSEIVASASNLIKKIKPNILYLPFKNDVHSDHRIVFDAFFSCTKSFRYPFLEEVLMMEVLSETDFAPSFAANSFCPNVFVDISKTLSKKLKALNIFREELAPFPFPRSLENIEALAKVRGSLIGAKAGEAFMLLKSKR